MFEKMSYMSIPWELSQTHTSRLGYQMNYHEGKGSPMKKCRIKLKHIEKVFNITVEMHEQIEHAKEYKGKAKMKI